MVRRWSVKIRPPLKRQARSARAIAGERREDRKPVVRQQAAGSIHRHNSQPDGIRCRRRFAGGMVNLINFSTGVLQPTGPAALLSGSGRYRSHRAVLQPHAYGDAGVTRCSRARRVQKLAQTPPVRRLLRYVKRRNWRRLRTMRCCAVAAVDASLPNLPLLRSLLHHIIQRQHHPMRDHVGYSC